MAASNSTLACPQAECLVQAGLQSRALYPSDPEYKAREDSYWSSSAKLSPACIVRPQSAEEVATAVRALAGAGQPFAVRSAGHTNWAGANNIAGGVTIDLTGLSHVEYDAATETVAIGPGQRWRSVYGELRRHKRVVAGGREGGVGVAGLLLGGGNTFFTGRSGMACDHVLSYDLVLADGRIIKVDRDSHPDLWRCLKGGSNNFGIVTNFVMKAIESDRVWGGMTFYPRQTTDAAIEALVDFTDHVTDDVDSNIVCMFTHIPEFKDIVVAVHFAQVSAVEKAPAYNKFMALPEITNTVKTSSIHEMAVEYNIPPGSYTVWFTLSFKNDARIVRKASELHEKLVEELKQAVPEGDFVTQCLFQPLPRLFAERSAQAGGNVMGMEQHAHNGLLFLATAMMKTAEQEALAYPLVKKWIEDIQAFAGTIDGGNLSWLHLNYADKSQDVFGGYGPENLALLRRVAAEYDPDQVFQKLCPGGFKLARGGD